MTEQQQVALIEYIAHLSLEDWGGVAKDLEALGFLPEDLSLEVEGNEQLEKVMAEVMSTWDSGGARIQEQNASRSDLFPDFLYFCPLAGLSPASLPSVLFCMSTGLGRPGVDTIWSPCFVSTWLVYFQQRLWTQCATDCTLRIATGVHLKPHTCAQWWLWFTDHL